MAEDDSPSPAQGPMTDPTKPEAKPQQPPVRPNTVGEPWVLPTFDAPPVNTGGSEVGASSLEISNEAAWLSLGEGVAGAAGSPSGQATGSASGQATGSASGQAAGSAAGLPRSAEARRMTWESHSLETPEERYDSQEYPRPRWRWPVILFGLTVVSTIWVGICGWSPLSVLEQCLAEGSFMPLRQAVLANWLSGLLYSLFLLGILMAHELGHYLVARWYRVPATPPLFLPFPINSIGTLGAVIAMQGHEADRRQIFDIGIAGPLAGLVLAFPVALLGTWQLDLAAPRGGGLGFEIPLAMRWMIVWFHPEYGGQVVWLSQLNPAFTAAWVALLVTGLNMMPVSQLDGGHVTYGLFVRWAHGISYLVLIAAIAYMVYQQILIMALMVALLLLMGPTHPPTSDDSVPLGWPRIGLGLASLLIPVLCFPPNVFRFNF